MPDTTNDIADLLRYLETGVIQTSPLTRPRWHSALAALVAERNELKAGVGRLWQILESAADRPPIDQTIADALTALVAERNALASEVGGLRSAMKAQDDRERDAGERCGVSRDLSGCDWPDSVADEVIALKKRVAELEAASKPADRDLRYPSDAMVRWMDQVTAMLCHSMTHSHDAKQKLVKLCDEAITAMRREGESDGK